MRLSSTLPRAACNGLGYSRGEQGQGLHPRSLAFQFGLHGMRCLLTRPSLHVTLGGSLCLGSVQMPWQHCC